ncbi:MAG: NUDIX domain-containing protein [Acidobacteriota bacterium]
MKFKKSGFDSGFAVYENQQHGFRMRFPRDWAKFENFGDAIVAFVRPGKLLKKSFGENVNVTYHDLSDDPMGLERFVDVSLEDLKVKIPGFTMMTDQDITLAGMPGREIVYYGDFKKKEKLQWFQTLLKKDDRIYVITCAAPQEKFDQFLKTARSMLESFSWIDNAQPVNGGAAVSDTQKTHVVTCLLVHEGKMLLLKRSGQVGSYQEKWAGVSGYIEEGNTPLQQAFRELQEETGLTERDIASISEGQPLEVLDDVLDRTWVIHPFRISIDAPDMIKLDWEHTELRWIAPEEINDYQTVPQLDAVWARVK